MRRNERRIGWAVLQACVIALLISCDSTEPEAPPTPVAGLRLEAQSDTALTGTAGSGITTVPVVRLTLDGEPAPGREVRFLASSGGTIGVSVQRTDTAGLASPGRWILASTVRPQTLTARVEGVADLVFTAIVAAGLPATIEILAGNHQTAAVGADLPTPLQVRLADRFGNPVQGEPVTFRVVTGNGAILGDSLKTDALGMAKSGIWTLGELGAQFVRASAGGKEVLFEAFACDNPCRGQDFLFERTGSLYTVVNGDTTLLNNWIPDATWSPDGQRIAYSRWNYDEETDELSIMNGDGSNDVLRAYGFHDPSWSPDGQRLAVTGRDGVYTLDVDQNDSAPVLLAEHASDPAWSPDGSRIAFVNYRDATLSVMNADGSAVTTLLHGDTDSPSTPDWSPDGQRLAFAKCTTDACKLFIMSADGSNLVQATEADAGSPAWSPDGSRIAFLTEQGIAWIPADGSIREPISMIPGASHISWRP